MKNALPDVLLFPVETDDGMGYIDPQGKELFVLDANIVSAHEFHDGLAMIEVKGKKTTAGYIDRNGRIAIPAEFSGAYDFSDGLACVRAGKNGWGYIDTSGTMKLKPAYEWAGSFVGGVAAVKRVGQEGITLIDRDGNTVAQTKSLSLNKSPSCRERQTASFKD